MTSPATRSALPLAASLAGLLAAVTCQAQSAPTKLGYAIYSHGFQVAELDASILLSASDYTIRVGYRLTGLAGLFASSDSTTTVSGRFGGGGTVPRQMFSVSHSRGQTRTTQLDWQDGSPVTTQLIPPIGAERELVPAAEQARTVDTLSALAGLLRQVATTGRCDASQRTFDGRRLSTLTARTVGEERLDATGRSFFAGAALRCDFQGRQIGGFSFDSDPATRGNPQPGSAWFAPLRPGGPPLPVRISFESPSIGTATLYVKTID